MTLQLRQYQQDAVNQTIHQLNINNEPCLIDASVSSGKTFLVAGLFEAMLNLGRNSMCLTATSELVDQNAQCYSEFVAKPSVFCASLNKKNYKLPAVFGSPQSVWVAIQKGHPIGKKFIHLLAIDECDNINFKDDKTTYMKIINHYLAINPQMRIVGLTGTPFRGKGVSIVGDDQLFKHVTAKIQMPWLVANGFVVPITYSTTEAEAYDFSNCKLQNNGKYKASEIAEAAEGKGRLTSTIIDEVVRNSQKQGGVIIFGATIAHCIEIMESLPPGISAMLTGKTPAKERASIIKRIKSGALKYIVNVSVLTVGFSAPIISHVVWLRKTESMRLYVQGNGRGVRMEDGKTHCLVSDYAGNLDYLGDVDDPTIVKALQDKLPEDAEYQVPCPCCDTLNTIFARRCIGFKYNQEVQAVKRCDYFFSFKECIKCGCENDATARECRKCGAEQIDPNKKLIIDKAVRITHKPIDVPVISTSYSRHKGKGGKIDTLKIDYLLDLPSRKNPIISEWISPEAPYGTYPHRIYINQFCSLHQCDPDLNLDDILANVQTLRNPTSILINKGKGEKYLNIVMKKFEELK